jgi:hypothetical protein
VESSKGLTATGGEWSIIHSEQQKGVIKMPRKYEANDQTTIDELRKKRVEAGSLTANSFTFSLLH